MNNYAGILPSQLIFVFDRWQDGYLGKSIDELNEYQYTAQTIYFITLIIVQFGNLHATRTRFASVFTHNPITNARNLYLYYAILGSLILALLVVYIPGLNTVLNIRPPPVEFWFMPLGFALLLILLDEGRKYIVRNYPKSIIAKIAW